MARPLYGGSYFGQGIPPSSYIDPYADDDDDDDDVVFIQRIQRIQRKRKLY
jgi:hypothetical protein